MFRKGFGVPSPLPARSENVYAPPQVGSQLGNRSLITISPTGGIGNQLFLYAAGRALALHRNTELEIDTWWHSTAGLDRRAAAHPSSAVASRPMASPMGPTTLRGAYGLINRLRQRFVLPAFRPIVTDEDGIARKTFFQAPSNAILCRLLPKLGLYGSLQRDNPRGDLIR